MRPLHSPSPQLKSILAVILIGSLALAAVSEASAAKQTESTTSEPPPLVANPLTRPKFQISLMGGAVGRGRNDLDDKVYKHQAGRSPAARLSMHVSLSPERDFQLLFGGDIISVRHVQVASSSRGSATYTVDDLYTGVTVGMAWVPERGASPFQLQGFIGVGTNPSREGSLQSSGFTTGINKNRYSTFAAWIELFATYTLSPQWRLTGGFVNVDGSSPILAGVAYAF